MSTPPDNPFTPRPGRIRSAGSGGRAKTYLTRMTKALSSAGGVRRTPLPARPRPAPRGGQRRVIVKARIVRMSASSAAALAAHIGSMTDSPIVVLILLAVFALVCGLFIDTLPALIILTPVMAPIAHQFGIDPRQFAMMLVLNLAIGMVTPPVGPVLFVVSTVGRLRIEALSRAVLPLLAAEIVVLLLVIFVPAISTAVPDFFGYSN